MAADWHAAGAAGDVEDDQPLSASIGGKEIGIYRVNGEYYALEDVCPHAYAILSQGFVIDGEIECPLHAARFDIRTGKCTAEPGGRDLDTYPVKIENGQVFVKVNV
jgi:NAD(P)H-dependent nitrite reductase small subunit